MTTRLIWVSASKYTWACAPVAFSVPWVITTLPVSVLTLFGFWKPSKFFAATCISCWRSLFLASAGWAASRPRAAMASANLALARREGGMDIIEQLQVFVVEVGTHADAADSSAALHHLRRGGGFQAVLFRPGGDVGGLHVGGRRVVERRPVHFHRALQLELAA